MNCNNISDIDLSCISNITETALRKITQVGTIGFIKNKDRHEIIIEDTMSYRLTLDTENPEQSPNCNLDNAYIEVSSLTMDDKGFLLVCDYENSENKDSGKVVFRFSNLTGKISVFNPCEIFDQPFDSIVVISKEILNKCDLFPDLCNSKEIEMLPLFKEISGLNCISEEKRDFSLLKELFSEYGFYKIRDKLTVIENTDVSSAKLCVLLQTMLVELNKTEYETIWREIYQKISDSQRDYPKKGEALTDSRTLKKIRREIEIGLLSRGYKGTYPDFYKEDCMKGFHLATSYGMSYFAGLKNKVKFFIHCTEEFDDSRISVVFISGTDLTKGGKCRDIYDCMFNDSGKRLFYFKKPIIYH